MKQMAVVDLTCFRKKKELEEKTKHIKTSGPLAIPMLRTPLQCQPTEEAFNILASNSEAKRKVQLEAIWDEYKDREVQYVEPT